MDGYLMREDAPLSTEEWGSLDQMVVEVAKRILVGRRIVHLFGPLGAGAQFVTVDRLDDKGTGPYMVDLGKRRVVPLATIERDFVLLWRDMAGSQQTHIPFEMGPVALAAAMCAQAEDALIFKGQGEAEGLLTAKGRLAAAMGAWDEPGQAINAVAGAVGELMSKGVLGPFALVVNPVTYARLLRPLNGMQLEIKLVEEVTEAGVFQTPALDGKQAVVMGVGPENMDLAIGQDLVTAYLGPEGMEHRFRLVETVALRIKRPAAICVLQG